MDDVHDGFLVELDADRQTLTLSRRSDPKWKARLDYQQPEPGWLTLTGHVDERPVRARLRRTHQSELRLTQHGFHWITE
jgi:hypothetical protein